MLQDDEHPNNASDFPSRTRLGSDKLTDSEMERFLGLELTALCCASNAHTRRSRMTDAMKEELNQIYYDFQCDVVRLSIQNRVRHSLYFEHLGQNRRIQGGGKSWNNFQKYDPAAQRLYEQYGRDVGGAQVSALWASKSGQEKACYCDVGYVNSLQEVVTTPTNNTTSSSNATNTEAEPTNTETKTTNTEAEPTNAQTKRTIIPKKACLNGIIQTSNVSQQKTLTLVTDWVCKTEADMKSMAFFHQVKGFLVLASRHPKSPIFRKVGSPLGNGFLNMLALDDKTDAAAEFHTWVAAQAIQQKRGCNIVAKRVSRVKPTGDIRDQFRVGNLNNNVHVICVRLRELINIASGGKVQAAWPGIDCKEKLKAWKLSVTIDENDWGVTVDNIQRPLVEVAAGPDKAILACLGLNKVHVTYHGNETNDAEDARPRKRRATHKRKQAPDSTSIPNNADTSNSVVSGSNTNANEASNSISGSRTNANDASNSISASRTNANHASNTVSTSNTNANVALNGSSGAGTTNSNNRTPITSSGSGSGTSNSNNNNGALNTSSCAAGSTGLLPNSLLDPQLDCLV
ncbi:hypothetical protein PCASD_17908 [Puccinia coronata f. sp. avenae]|uniref:Uncharacterized protein n=1 Tax=Puccinia coronata f. sp. avenae TaxID=200324 RepID=A0A2N5U944_9BASI|nr:hypothetical protein PCASD_17908 [Puccinia coronata f. sp. avenae]